MAITFVVGTPTAYTTSASVTLAKPTGLAVGDFMVAYIHGAQESVTPPSGWTSEQNFISTSGNGQMRIYSKTADSSDVSASNWTWTYGGGQYHGGVVIKFSGHNTALPMVVQATANTTGTASPSFTSTVTPNTANSVLLFCLGVYVNSSATRTSSAYAVTTSNPTWTEELDQNVNTGSSCFQMAVASATRSQITATGNASCTMSSSCTDLSNIMLVIRPQIQATITDTVTTTDSVTKLISKVITETISLVETITKVKSRLWTKKTKPSNTWTKKLK